MPSLAAAYRHIKFRRKNRSLGMDILLALFLGLFAVFSIYPMVFIANNLSLIHISEPTRPY